MTSQIVSVTKKKGLEDESKRPVIRSVKWWGRKIISSLPSCMPSWVESVVRVCFQIPKEPHFPFLRLPRDAQIEVVKFLLPEQGFFAVNDARKVFQLSKECASLEVECLQSRASAINEIMKKVQGSISKLPKESRLALNKIGPTITTLELSGFPLTLKMVKEIVSYFPNLQELACSNCRLKNSHINEIAKLQSLVRLDVSYNQFTNKSVRKITSLTNLTFLSLAYCQNIGTHGLRSLHRLIRLEELSLEGCKSITDKSLFQVAKLVNLNALHIGSCSQITAAGLHFLTALKKLTKLSLKLCLNVKDVGLKVLPLFPQLTMVDLTSCYNITNEGLRSVFACEKLQKLVMAYFRVTDEPFASIHQLKKLKNLAIIGCLNLTDRMCESLAKLGDLEELTLENCQSITDQGVSYFKHLTKLTFLSLEGCHHISDQGVYFLTANSNLEGIKFAKSENITGTTFHHLVALEKLKMLSLKRCHHIIDTDLHYLKKLKQLRLLALIHCARITERGRAFLKTKLAHIQVLDVNVPIESHRFRLF